VLLIFNNAIRVRIGWLLESLSAPPASEAAGGAENVTLFAGGVEKFEAPKESHTLCRKFYLTMRGKSKCFWAWGVVCRSYRVCVSRLPSGPQGQRVSFFARRWFPIPQTGLEGNVLDTIFS
jgi:hypothetical protein